MRSATPHPSVGGLPLPLFAIEVVRRYGIEQQSILSGRVCGLERLFPALARRAVRGDDQAVLVDADIDRVAEAALLNEWLGNSDAPRVTDGYKFNFHKKSPVITL